MISTDLPLCGLASDRSGYIWLVDGSCVRVFDPEGALVREADIDAADIAIDASDNVLLLVGGRVVFCNEQCERLREFRVADYLRRRIAVYEHAGQYFIILWAEDEVDKSMLLYHRDGTLAATWPIIGLQNVAVDRHGQIFIDKYAPTFRSVERHREIHVFDIDRNLQRVINFFRPDSQFDTPIALACDRFANLLVCDVETHVCVFSGNLDQQAGARAVDRGFPFVRFIPPTTIQTGERLVSAMSSGNVRLHAVCVDVFNRVLVLSASGVHVFGVTTWDAAYPTYLRIHVSTPYFSQRYALAPCTTLRHLKEHVASLHQFGTWKDVELFCKEKPLHRDDESLQQQGVADGAMVYERRKRKSALQIVDVWR